ncbi:hypothetical protein ACWHA1_39365 [Streptomyces decoyicus]
MLTTRTHEQTQLPQPQHLYQVLATLASLGRGPHSLPTLTRHSGLDRQTVREQLAAMVEAGLCTVSAALPGRYALAMRVVGTESTWLLHALPTVEAHTHDQLRALHQATGQVVLLHSHTLLPPVRICVDHYCGDRSNFLQQLAAHPTADTHLRQAPLGADAPGLVIQAHLDPAPPQAAGLQRIRTAGYATSEAALPGWSLLSVPVHAGPASLGLWELTGTGIAGAVSLAVPTPGLDPNLIPWLNELQRTALELATAQDGHQAPYWRRVA